MEQVQLEPAELRRVQAEEAYRKIGKWTRMINRFLSSCAYSFKNEAEQLSRLQEVGATEKEKKALRKMYACRRREGAKIFAYLADESKGVRVRDTPPEVTRLAERAKYYEAKAKALRQGL